MNKWTNERNGNVVSKPACQQSWEKIIFTPTFMLSLVGTKNIFSFEARSKIRCGNKIICNGSMFLVEANHQSPRFNLDTRYFEAIFTLFYCKMQLNRFICSMLDCGRSGKKNFQWRFSINEHSRLERIVCIVKHSVKIDNETFGETFEFLLCNHIDFTSQVLQTIFHVTRSRLRTRRTSFVVYPSCLNHRFELHAPFRTENSGLGKWKQWKLPGHFINSTVHSRTPTHLV